MKPTLILLALLALSASSATAQVRDPAACDRCVAARGCPSDADTCRENCPRAIQQGVTPDPASAIERCVQECFRQLDTCMDVARLSCASARQCM